MGPVAIYEHPETRHYNNEHELRKEVKGMPRGKQYIFSARTTEEGLRLLNELKAKLGMGWDEFVIDAMCTKYGLDRDVLALPKVERPPKTEKPKRESKPKAEKKAKGKGEKKIKGEKAKTAKGKPVAKILISPPPNVVEARSLPKVGK